MRTSLVLLGLGILLAAAGGCAHGGSTSSTAAPLVVEAASQAPVELPVLARPQTQAEARRALELAFAARRAGDDGLAAAQLRAVLASDFLTDVGRMNVYWHAAVVHHEMGDRLGERDALEGFLLSSEVVPQSEVDESRTLLARSELAAVKVAEVPGFGRSPGAPIVVEDLREPDQIVAALSCGSGRARLIELQPGEPRNHSRLVMAKASCAEGGPSIDLWFDVTWADDPDAEPPLGPSAELRPADERAEEGYPRP